MSNNVGNIQRYWLIRSATRILGPYTLEELTEQIKTKQISIVDEVRQPEGRWSYIRENQMFMDIVESIRDEQDPHSEKTMTQSVAQHTAITRTDVNIVSDDLTPTPTPTPWNRSVENMKDVTSSSENTVRPGASGTARSYGFSNDSRVRGKLQKKSDFFRWILFGAGIVAASLIVLTLTQREKKKSIGYDELMAQAIRYKTLGLYEKSLQSYKKAASLREPDLEAKIQMAPILISEDRQSLVGRRILEQALMKEGRPRAEVVNAYLGIAVSYMMDGDLQQAEDTLQKTIGYDPSNAAAHLNFAIIQQKKGNHLKAIESFDLILRKNAQSSLALFGRALSVLEYSQTNSDSKMLPDLIRAIDAHVKKSGYLRQELLLFLVYAQSLLGDVDSVNQAVVRFLSELPGQMKNYTHPLFVDWRFTQWDYLEKYCAEVIQKNSTNPELKAFRAVCLMEVNRDMEAAKMLEEAFAEAPKDPYVLIVQASYLKKIGRIPEARAILKMPELQTLTAKHLLAGEICIETHDGPCAASSFALVQEADSTNTMASYGLAWSRLQSPGGRSNAYEYIRLGLQAEPNFLPLLDLRDQLEYER